MDVLVLGLVIVMISRHTVVVVLCVQFVSVPFIPFVPFVPFVLFVPLVVVVRPAVALLASYRRFAASTFLISSLSWAEKSSVVSSSSHDSSHRCFAAPSAASVSSVVQSNR